MTTDHLQTPEDRLPEDASDHQPHQLDFIAAPTTIGELATLRGTAPLDVIEARVQIVETLRRASIRATHPEDWLLFKAPDEAGGQIVGYLQDAGCDRVRDLWGIEIFGIGRPEKIAGDQPGVFHYVITGNGRCKLTKQTVEAMEGGRSSTDDFCKDRTGADLELSVRKAARANLDGNITRELAGLKAVPIEEIERAWTGTAKKTAQCRHGRGFGSRSERLGAEPASAPDVQAPKCGVCGALSRYRPASGSRGAFYGCPNYQKHADRKWTMDAAKWIEQAKKTAAAAPAEPATREPGAEG